MTIKTKILFTLLGMSLLVGLVGVLSVNRQRASATVAALKEAEHVASVVGLLMSERTTVSTAPQEIVEKLHRAQKRDVVLVNTKKRIVADADLKDVGTDYQWDRGNEIGLTMKDRKVRIFVEQGIDHPSGIKQIVVAVEADSGEVIGASILEYTPLFNEMMRLTRITIRQMALIAFGSAAIAILLALYMGRTIGTPLQQLTNAATGFAAGRTDSPMPSHRTDEIGLLVTAFDSMIKKRQQAEDSLRHARDELDARVIERTAELAKANEALQIENTERSRAETGLREAQGQLVDTSRRAGMAEVATSVLHNVGNVLNSVNVASSCVADSLRKSKSANLSKAVALMQEHETDLGDFLTNDPKGRQLPGYLAQLSEHLTGEQALILKELAGLQKNIEHIKDIVTMQQGFAKVSGITETLRVMDIVDDALRMNASGLLRHDVQVVNECGNIPPVTLERSKVMQILVNLISNAKYACDNSASLQKRLVIRTSNGDGTVRILVSDNGIGISSENLSRIFAHGFTTRKEGHGFGLHSAALAAKEMGGSLTVESDGPDRGATFTLEFPLKTNGTK